MKNTNPLQDFKINVRFKLSALWTTVMFCYIYGDYFSLYVPRKIEEFINGNNMLDSPQKLFGASLLMVIPSLMVFLSLVSNPKISKWLNVVVGIIYTAIMILIAVTSISPWWTFYVFLAIVESSITSLVVWYALKWPKQHNVSG